ncbi:MAG: hypothetical protein V4608_15170 [Bacteroidota bacterium]
MIAAIITILGGVLAAAGFFIARKPNAKELIDKITPYQGWVGIILFLWGVWQTISVLLNLAWISSNLIFWIIWVVLALSNLFVGFLLGFGLISKYALSKNEEAMEKGQRIRLKLVKFQIPLGFISIAVGLLFLFFYLGLFMVGYISFGVIIIGYIILMIVAGKPQTGDVSIESTTVPGSAQKQNASATSTTTAGNTFYEIRISNVSNTAIGATYKVGMTITAKKFVVDAKTGKEREEMINDEIQIGMVKGGKEIYLKSYRFTKTVTPLSLTLDQKPDKIGVDPYNKLPERA